LIHYHDYGMGKGVGRGGGAEVHDPLGNVSRLQFDDIRRNQDLPDDRFVFQLPQGVDVITAPVLQ